MAEVFELPRILYKYTSPRSITGRTMRDDSSDAQMYERSVGLLKMLLCGFPELIVAPFNGFLILFSLMFLDLISPQSLLMFHTVSD